MLVEASKHNKQQYSDASPRMRKQTQKITKEETEGGKKTQL